MYILYIRFIVDNFVENYRCNVDNFALIVENYCVMVENPHYRVENFFHV